MDSEKIQLVRQAKKGKQSAFEALFLMEKEYLYKTAMLYMKNQEDALDLVQECILQCMLSIRRLQNPEYFKTWMTSVLINCARKEWKKKNRYAEEELVIQQVESSKESLSREEKMDLYDAIDLLSFPYKAIIIQKYFLGAKLDEIAELLGMPLNTVKVYHVRAKEQLKTILKEDA